MPKVLRAAIAFLIAGGVVSRCLAATPTKDIAVTVKVHTIDGEPIARLPLAVSTHRDQVFGDTDETGVMTLTVSAFEPEKMVLVFPTAVNLNPDANATAEDLERTVLGLVRTLAIKESYSARIEEGSDECTIELVPPPAVQLSGTLVDHDGRPIVDAMVWQVGNPGPCVIDEETGEFEVGGIARGEPATLAVLLDGTPWQPLFQLQGNETAENRDLGDLKVPLHTPDAAVEIAATHTDGNFVNPHPTSHRGFALIRDDASSVYTLFYDEELRGQYLGGTSVPVVSGTYYIVPGVVNTMHMGRKVTALLRDGRQNTLDAAGVPKIVVQPGESKGASFDPLEAEKAILSIQ